MSQSEHNKLTPNFEIPILENLEFAITFAFSQIKESLLLSLGKIFTYL